MAPFSILPCPQLDPTEQVERALSDLLSDLDRAEGLISQLTAGVDFDASLEIRAARRSLLRALQALNQPEPVLVEVA